MRAVRFAVVVAVLVALAVPVAGQGTPSQIAAGESLTLTTKVVAFDPATRAIVLEGPFGGQLLGLVSTDVKDVSKLVPGAMVSASYHQAIAAAVRRQGDTQPLTTAADAAAVSRPGMPASEKASMSTTLSVVSVDLPSNTVVFKNKEGTLLPTEVMRPEFRAKLKDLRAGDQVEVTYSDALVTGIQPAAAGAEAKLTMRTGTLVIDHGEVVRRSGDTILVRNESGRILKVHVDPDYKFQLEGKEATVRDLKPGMKLSRTALRVVEVDLPE